MSWLDGISSTERREMMEEICEAFHDMLITEDELRQQLGKLGYNATDIEENIEENRP
jgi:hypothetical protein